jgi:molecular chaperone DnaJ
MAVARDLYDVLGVQRGASQDEIKTAYRKLARALHPDVNADPGSEVRFKEVAGAYEILSDPQKRQRYDTFGSTGGQGAQGFTDIQDIFDMFFGAGFGGGRSRGAPSRVQQGESFGVRVSLSFREAVFGARRDLDIERLATCDRCAGNGAEPGTTPVPCRTCGGSGEVQSVRRSIFGAVMTASTCTTCGGAGQEIANKCTTCRGEGRVRARATVNVEFPAGVADGMELRVTGGGHAGISGGPPGDLYGAIGVEESGAFERRGQDLFTVLDIPVTQAALGGEIEFETLDGPERFHVDPGTESGTVSRMKGKGVPHVNRRGRGDLFVTLHVVTPRDLSREERDLLEQLSKLRNETTSKHQPASARLRRPDFSG